MTGLVSKHCWPPSRAKVSNSSGKYRGTIQSSARREILCFQRWSDGDQCQANSNSYRKECLRLSSAESQSDRISDRSHRRVWLSSRLSDWLASVSSCTMARGAGWGVMVSHRSGETEDSFIADLVVGLGTGQVGWFCSSELMQAISCFMVSLDKNRCTVPFRTFGQIQSVVAHRRRTG